ncbi:hypothetical protein TWF730_009090 [Orbilia blumenaviensis]|uniref:F-box domain-containing protein n=1 Tax=Orbilia blumenaviensis TaxID=1796055 RepID=A0AAV9UXZ8_9PEZI
MTANYTTKTTPIELSAATRVLYIPELLERILYFVITTSPPDIATSCKTANILRFTCSLWAGTINSSPTLSALAFRNHKLPPNRIGNLCLPFLQSLQFEFSQIDQMRYFEGKTTGLTELKQFIASQKLSTPAFPAVRKALGLPTTQPSSAKYLGSNILLLQPPPPESASTYLYFSGWGNKEWLASLETHVRPGDLYRLGNTIEFNYWYKLTSSSGDGNITGADLVAALTSVLGSFYKFRGGFFEVLHVELVVGKPLSTPPSIYYLHRWYLWHPKKFGGRGSTRDLMFDFICDRIVDVISFAGYITLIVAKEFIIICEGVYWGLRNRFRSVSNALHAAP